MLKGKMTGGGGKAAASDKKELRAAKKMEKTMGKAMDKQMKTFVKSKDPMEGLNKSASKFAKKADKIVQKYNKKK